MSEQELFSQALDLPRAEREQFLRQHCADPALRDRVLRMLAIAEEPSQAPTGDAPTGEYHEPTERIGSLIAGRYKLLEQIGEGGMGTVYMSQQILPVKRTLAVKVVKPGMDSKQVLARFDAERQALAMMDHPNIARVYDAGLTDDSRPFFVMELVKGMPITKYCDERKLNPRERVELFVPVCQAIQHAHQKGIIHRDIKPANVLVGLYDDRPVPKVIDFGIAKSMGGALTDATMHTAFGVGIGTPQYMSPEQAGYNNLDVDTRSDIYALGVLLYELLAGNPPLDTQRLKQAVGLEIFRLIREEEPVKPSTKLSTSAALPSIAASRKTEPGKLSALLRGELDWIVMKALDKERNRRYETANGFAADLQRYLTGEAVLAAPPSVGYRVRKWVRKNKGPAVAATLVFSTLTVGVAATSLMYLQAKRQERKTAEALVEVEKQRDVARRNLMRSYLGTIGNRNDVHVFDEAELQSIRKIGALESDEERFLFLEQMLAEPEPAFRAARRMERIVQAVVGTRIGLRTKALELALTKQKDTEADPRIRATASLLAMHLGSDDLPALPEMVELVLVKYPATSDQILNLDYFEESVLRNLNVLNSNRLCDALVVVLGKTNKWQALRAAVNVLLALAPRLAAAASQRAAAALVATLAKTNDRVALNAASNTFQILVPKLDIANSQRAVEALIATLGETKNGDALKAAENALQALAPKLDVANSQRAVEALIATLGETKDGDALEAAAHALQALAPKLDPATFQRAADTLIATLEKTNDPEALIVAGNALNALAPIIDPAYAQRAADTLFATLAKTNDWRVLTDACYTLRNLAPKLEPAVTKRAADALVATLGKINDWRPRLAAKAALEAVAPKLDPASARSAADALLATLAETSNRDTILAAKNALQTLAPSLDPITAQRAVDAILATLAKTPNQDVFRAAANAIKALAPKLDSASAQRAADALLVEINDPFTCGEAGEALNAIAPKLDSAAFQRAFIAIVAVLGKADNSQALLVAGNSLVAFAPKMNPTNARLAADTLVATLTKSNNQDALRAAGRGLVAIAPKLDPANAQSAAEALIATFSKTNNPDSLSAVGNGLAAIAPKINGATSQLAADTLVAILGETEDGIVLQATGNALLSFFPKIEEAVISRLLENLILKFHSNEDPGAIRAFSFLLQNVGLVEHYLFAFKDSEAIDAKLFQLIDMAGRRPQRSAFFSIADSLNEAIFRKPTNNRRLLNAIFFDRLLHGYLSDLDGFRTTQLNIDNIHEYIIRELEDTNPPEVRLLQHLNGKDLANILKHPGCIGSLKRAVLARMEEIAYSRSKVTAIGALPGVPGLGLGILSAGEVAEREVNRKFRTHWDAVAWLQKHHPEIDLDSPYQAPPAWKP